MGQYKRRFMIYSAWNYEKEIEDLNALSKKGWQLVKGGCFSSLFEKNPNVQYRYQLDYGKIEKSGRYMEIFREQGWEYVNSTFNGWHYFRKQNDESLPEEEYEIYTDRESLQEMRGRWVKVAVICMIVIACIALMFGRNMAEHFNLPNVILFSVGVMELLLLSFGVYRIGRQKKGKVKNGKLDSLLIALFFAVLIGGKAFSLYLDANRLWLQNHSIGTYEDLSQMYELEENGDIRWITFDISYKDNYDLKLISQSEEDATISLLDSDGRVICQMRGNESEQTERMMLQKGSYKICISDCPDGVMDLEVVLQ